MRSLNGPTDLFIPAAYVDPGTQNPNTLSTELGYQFLPHAWGKGYATEAVGAVLNAVKDALSFWAPYEKLYIRALVNELNPASQNVMKKLKWNNVGTWEWTGDKVFLGGEWITVSRICIYDKWLIE